MKEQKRDVPIVFEIQSYLKRIESGYYLLNHPLQRASGQWSAEEKGNLIRKILQCGNVPAFKICEQIDEKTNMKKRWVVDGLQRTTVIRAFVNNGFAIGNKTIDYMVEYDGVVYEKKENKNNRFALKRKKDGTPIELLNEDGVPYTAHQTIDIRGLKFKDLPPELQESFLCYQLAADMSYNCTARDVQIEILDLNSGKKMNKAQIGMTALTADWAKYVVELSKHPFIKDKCGFTDKNEVQGFITKSIGEALMLVNYQDYWLKDYKELCRFLADGNLSQEHINHMKKMFDILDEILPVNEGIQEMLKPKEFFIVINNFAYFLTKGYKNECYAMFLKAFVEELKDVGYIPIEEDGVFLSYSEICPRGEKSTGAVIDRVESMTYWLEKFLEENCADMVKTEDDEDFAEIEEYMESNVDTNSILENLIADESGRVLFTNISVCNGVSVEDSIIACNMIVSRFPKKSMERARMVEFVSWCGEEDYSAEEYIETMDEAEDILNLYHDVGEVLNTKTLPVFLMLFNHSNIKDFEEWLDYYVFDADHSEIDLDCELNNENMMALYSKLYANFKQYFDGKEDDINDTEENY